MKKLKIAMFIVKLSCIVVNYNKADLTIACVNKLRESLQDLSYEIIVVDNGSSDLDVKKIKAIFPHISVIELDSISKFIISEKNLSNLILVKLKKNYGFAVANNIGMSIARGEYFLLINNDAYITKDTLDELINFMDKNPKAGMVAPKVIWPDGTPQYTAGRTHNFLVLLGRVFKIGSIIRKFNTHIWKKFFQPGKRFTLSSKAQQVEVVSGVCVLLRREVFIQTGGFDENFFMYLEDIDLSDRVRANGWEIWYLPFVKVIHLGGASFEGGAFRDIQWEAYKSLLYYFFKHKGKRGLICAKLIIIIGLSIRLFFCLFHCLIRPSFSKVTICKQITKVLRHTIKYKVKI